MSELLNVNNIYVSIQDKPILRGVSFSVHKDEIYGLVGTSGSGKSTAAYAITGLLPLNSGGISLDGRMLSGRRSLDDRRKIQMVFQNPEGSLNPKIKIGKILGDAMRLHFPGISNGETERRSSELIERLELPADTLKRYPRNFSGGEKQRIALARALCVEPELLIADEPTSSLDVSVQLKILKLIKEIKQERSLSILFISHDLGVINYLCDSVAFLHDGIIVENEDKESFFESPKTAWARELIEAVPRL